LIQPTSQTEERKVSLPVFIAIIVVADLALIAGLAWAMSRAARLTPHVSARPVFVATTQPAPRSSAARRSPKRTRRAVTPLHARV
jgi:hypothetical protein